MEAHFTTPLKQVGYATSCKAEEETNMEIANPSESLTANPANFDPETPNTKKSSLDFGLPSFDTWDENDPNPRASEH